MTPYSNKKHYLLYFISSIVRMQNIKDYDNVPNFAVINGTLAKTACLTGRKAFSSRTQKLLESIRYIRFFKIYEVFWSGLRSIWK